jgi:hypothetical protein
VAGAGKTIKRRSEEVVHESSPPASAKAASAKTASAKPASAKVSKPRKPIGVRIADRSKPMVPKPPLFDFPREVCGVVELQPGTPDDYLRVYTADGSFPVDEFPEAWSQQEKSAELGESLPANDADVVEDGNVDYCQVCKNHGNLLCCDFCPRAFHLDCVEGDTRSSSNGRWECRVCKKEKAGWEADIVDGKKSLDLICGSFLYVDGSDEKVRDGLKVLSIIHEMLVKLMEYEFGYMFCKPVDCDAIVGYKDAVKNPMDLGTICSKLVNGGYTTILKEDGSSFDDVITAVLKDVELVWHDCFTFNFDGSAIHRMADVHKRRARAICRRSFYHLLSDAVKNAVRDFVRSCEIERGHFTPPPGPGPTSSTNLKEKNFRFRRPKGKNKITVKATKTGASRPVAILDAVTGRIVKIYTTMKAAQQATHSLISLGHRCEWSSTHDLVKTMVPACTTNPSILMFGYRWLMLDELRAGKVQFPKATLDAVEMRNNEGTYVFLSIDEAVSFSELPRTLQLGDLREQLASLSRGIEWTDISGLKWRRPNTTNENSEKGPSSTKNGDSALLPDAPESDLNCPLQDTDLLKESAVAKEDLVTNRKLVGFETVSAAFQDWMQTARCAATFPESEATTIEKFEQYYLDGDRNIDGIAWKSMKPAPAANGDKQTRAGKESSEQLTKVQIGLAEKGQFESQIGTSTVKANEKSKDAIVPWAPQTDTVAIHTDECEESEASTSGKRKREDEADTAEAPVTKMSAADGRTKTWSFFGFQLNKDDSATKDEKKSTDPLADRQNGKDVRHGADATPVMNTAS